MKRIIHTIGYEGTDIVAFVATLRDAGIQMLADVRAVPLSRKKGFSKKALSANLEQHGIAYRHFGALGDPKPGREAARAGRYIVFRNIYEAHLSRSDVQTALRELEGVCRDRMVCLMCFERDARVCHRSIITDCLASAETTILHLIGGESVVYRGEPAFLSGRHSRQGAAAA